MRFQSPAGGDYRVFAVTGINTVSFGIKATDEGKQGLLGFAVERVDPVESERYFMPGYKVFASVIPHPDEDTMVSTNEHPIQSFVWDDFTAKPKRRYEYIFHPLRGKAKNLDRSAPPISLKVETEPLFSDLTHDIFFNRGVASSQAYRRRFGNLPPDKQETPAKEQEALQWLTRDLDEAIVRFIQRSTAGDRLLGCFYEFRYAPVAAELKAAIDRGVDVQLIIDGKVNESTDSDGDFHESFPRVDNLELLESAGITTANYTLREAKPNDIQHNKFLVWIPSGGQASEVWTGSTNLSLGGFSGQTNVGHWVRDRSVAQAFVAYWELLKDDPGPGKGLPRGEVIKLNRALHAAVEALGEVPTAKEAIPPGITPIFSPRSGSAVLDLYARLVDTSDHCSCITLAFGVSKTFKDQLVDNSPQSCIVFLLLEKRDRKNPRSTTPFIPLKASQNIYQAWGSYIRDPVYQWARETNAGILGLNHHVSYVHSKFLLSDPLGADPIVVTGSANFSEPSTNSNDENMLVIRGDQRVADIYFTEFNRLWNHYYFRSVREAIADAGDPETQGSLFLSESNSWTRKYDTGKLRAKRLALYTGMDGAVTL